MKLELTPMHFTSVDGVSVTVRVDHPEEAKHALKELRHLKRQVRHHRKDLVAAERAAKAREKRAKRQKPQPLFSSFGDYIGQSVASLATLLRPRAQQNAYRSARDIRADIDRLDDLIQNVDGTRLEIEGRLVTEGKPG